jgi:hypothetical protein
VTSFVIVTIFLFYRPISRAAEWGCILFNLIA